MKISFTAKDKLRIKICLAILIFGLLIIGAAFTPYNNPPQCGEAYTSHHELQTPQNSRCIIGANIGGGFVWLLGMAIAIAGGLTLAAVVILVLVRGNVRNPRAGPLITALIIGCIVLAAWYFFIGASAIKHAKYQGEIQKRQASFVQYKGTPKLGEILGRSAAVTAKPNAENASSITMDLHSCSPGAANVSYVSGTTHFAFSGVRKIDEYHDWECVFYVGVEKVNQKWDGLLHAKCVWRILDTVAENQQTFQVTGTGIEFGEFPSNCTDLRTGVVPRELTDGP